MNTLACMSNADLVARCRAGDNSAWHVFFQQFNVFIDRQLLKTFRIIAFDYEEPDVDEAKNAVIDTLLDPVRLGAITDPERLKAWLAQVCRSKARDVARSRRAIKNSADAASRQRMLSLHQPAGPSGSDALLEDSLASPCDMSQGNDNLFPVVGEAIEALEWIYRAPLKIQLLFYADFLSPGDICRIADERAVAQKCVHAEINRLLDDLVRRQAEAIKHEATIRVAAAYGERLKARCYELARRNADQDHIYSAQKAVEKNDARLSRLLSRKNKPVTPGNGQISAILGQKENVIATRLFRARRALEQHLLT